MTTLKEFKNVSLIDAARELSHKDGPGVYNFVLPNPESGYMELQSVYVPDRAVHQSRAHQSRALKGGGRSRGHIRILENEIITQHKQPVKIPTQINKGGGGAGYPGAGYTGAGYPGAGYPGAGYSGTGYPGAGYPGAGYSGAGYPGAGYSGAGYSGAGYLGAYRSVGHISTWPRFINHPRMFSVGKVDTITIPIEIDFTNDNSDLKKKEDLIKDIIKSKFLDQNTKDDLTFVSIEDLDITTTPATTPATAPAPTPAPDTTSASATAPAPAPTTYRIKFNLTYTYKILNNTGSTGKPNTKPLEEKLKKAFENSF